VPAILLRIHYCQNRAEEINQPLAALTISANSIAIDLDEKRTTGAIEWSDA
jgi:hypothetical protein